MSDSPPSPPPASSNPASTGATWIAPEGFPVYGATRGAPPPDLETPWEFMAPGEAPPPPPPPEAGPPPVYQQAAVAAPPEHAPPQPPPVDAEWLPPALGPAETPEDRARRLGIPPPGNPPGT